MKLRTWILVGVVTLGTSAWGATKPAEQVVKDLVEKRNVGLEEVKVRMELLDAQKKTRAEDRVFRMMVYSPSSETVKSLSIFDAPASIKGTKLLTIQEGTATTQWLYLPSFKRLTRIDSDSGDDGILDSDLSYNDLRSEEMKDNTYRYGGKSAQSYAEKYCGKNSSAIFAQPKEKKDNGQRLLLVDHAQDVICGVITFGEDNKVKKRLINKNFKKVGSVNRPSRVEIDTYDKGGKVLSSTNLKFFGWKTSQKADESLFSPDRLKL